MKKSFPYLFGSLFMPWAAHATDALPENLTNIDVQQTTIDTIARVLPERTAVGQDFLNSERDPNFYFMEDAQAAVTFITEGAGYRNSLGYFSFESGAFDGFDFSSIDTNSSGNISPGEIGSLNGVNEVGIVFGNVSGSGGFSGSGGSLSTGDTTVLGGGSLTLSNGEFTMEGGTTFQQGETLGFFLMANAWDGSQVRGWDTNQDVATYWTMDGLNPENSQTRLHAYTRHVAVLDIESQPEIILAFEDLRRPYGDNDFNDAVFTVQTNPIEAIDVSRFTSVSPAPLPSASGFLALMIVGGALTFGIKSRKEKV